MLTDLEYRVWVQYLLSADDFGVMRALPAQLQADNDHLLNRPLKALQRCLDAIVRAGLVLLFTHQGKPYACQRDWQKYQKVEWPRATHNPKPPADVLSVCDEATRKLFDRWPGGETRKKPKDVPSHLERTSQADPEADPSIRERAPAERLTANGKRLTANGSEGGLGETTAGDLPMDVWARGLVELYPAQGRCSWHLVERPLFAALTSVPPLGPAAAWAFLQTRLEQHKRSHQWRVKQMIPRLDKWLRDGLYLQELPEQPVSTLVTDRTAGTLEAASAIMRGKA